MSGAYPNIDLVGSLSGDQEVRIRIATVEQVHAGEEITMGRLLVDGGSVTQSVVVAGVVSTWVMRCGWPAFQVSVKYTL